MRASYPFCRSTWHFLLSGAAALFLTFPAVGAPDLNVQLDQAALDLDGATPADTIAHFRKLLPTLQAAEGATPGLALSNLAGRMTTDAFAAAIDEQAGLAALQALQDQPGADPRFLQTEAALVRPLFDLSRSGPDNPKDLHDLAKTIERLAAAGIGLSEIVGVSPDAYDLKTIEKLSKLGKVGADLGSLEATGSLNAKQFTDDVLSALPPELAPALASPAGKFFRDLMDWDQQMWTTSTDGLDLVSKAIDTGKLDTAAYDKIAQRLKALASQGPWTTQSGIDYVKKLAETLPVGGKLLKALWGGMSKQATSAGTTSTFAPTASAASAPSLPPALPLGKYSGDLTIRSLSACEEFAFESLNSPPGDAETGAFLTVTPGGATLVLEEEGSTKAADYFETSANSLMISPSRIVGGIRHQTTYYFDMAIAKSGSTGGYVATGNFIIQDGCEAQAPGYEASFQFGPVQ